MNRDPTTELYSVCLCCPTSWSIAVVSRLTFFVKIGNDHLMNLIEDWGIGVDNAQDPIPLKDLPLSSLQPLAILFGGVGDGIQLSRQADSSVNSFPPIFPARHVFGTIIGLQKAYAKLNKERKSVFRTHLTMIDIHPNPLARDLCLFMLLDELANDSTSEDNAIIIKATLFYAYVAVLMPIYCYNKYVLFNGCLILLIADERSFDLKVDGCRKGPSGPSHRQPTKPTILDLCIPRIHAWHHLGVETLGNDPVQQNRRRYAC